MDQRQYLKIKRIFALIVAVGLWCASNVFSVGGFNFEVDNMAWVGWTLALTITALELVFNSELNKNGRNFTLYVFGALGYFYGVSSNVIGIWHLQGNTDLNNIGANMVTTVFVVLISLMAEIVPEALFIFSLGVNDQNGEGDTLKNFLHSSGMNGGNSGGGNNSYNGPTRSQEGSGQKQSENRSNPTLAQSSSGPSSPRPGNGMNGSRGGGTGFVPLSQSGKGDQGGKR